MNIPGSIVPAGSQVSPSGEQGLQGMRGLEGSTVGTIFAWPSITPPAGSLLCDGSEVSRNTFWELYAIIGDTHGAGNGTTTFNLPDARDRMILGRGTTYNLGSKGGAATHTLTVAEMPSHNHSIQNTNPTAGGSGYGIGNAAGGVAQWGVSMTGGGGAHNNMPPYLVLTICIRARSRSDSNGRITLPEGSPPPQCGKLIVVGASPATTLRFIPARGNLIRIDGEIYRIPRAGIAANNTGVHLNGVPGQNLVVATLYYVYLFDDNGVLTFDYSTIGYETDDEGTEIKIGDPSRTLIGLIYTATGATFYDTEQYRFTRSWFNRSRTTIFVQATVTITSTTIVNAIGSSVVAFANEPLFGSATWYGTNTVSANIIISPGLNNVSKGAAAVTTNGLQAKYETGTASATWNIPNDGVHNLQLRVNASIASSAGGNGLITGILG
jgi:microcystin-dependent protein